MTVHVTEFKDIHLRHCVFFCVQVVQKKEAHDFRCLFRVCFMPRTLQTLLQEDPTSFEYLYLQVDLQAESS